MRGLFSHPPRGLSLEASPTEGTNQIDKRRLGSSNQQLRSRCGPKVVSALATVLAVAAVFFVVLHCGVSIVRRAKITGFAERRLARGGEEDGSESPTEGSFKVCEGLREEDEQQVRETHDAVFRPKRRGSPAVIPGGTQASERTSPGKTEQTMKILLEMAKSAAIAGGTQASERTSPGKTEQTMKILLEMAKSSEELSAFSHFSEETSASPSPAASERGTPESEEEPPTKKKKSGEVAENVAQMKEVRTSSLGAPGASSEGFGDDELDFPNSLVELYLRDTLQAAQEILLADWLIDPDADLPPILPVPGEEEVHVAAGQMGAEAPPSFEGFSLVSLEAAAIGPGQAHPDEVSQASGSVVSSTRGRPPEGASLPLLESAPPAADEPSTSAASAAATSPTAKEPAVSGVVPQELSSASTAGPSQALPPMDQHPFFKLPVSWPRNVPLPEFDFKRWSNVAPVDPLSTLLEEARRIFSQEELSVDDVRTLQLTGGQLISYVGRRFTRSLGLNDDATLIPRLGIRVLLAHYLLLVCEVVGPNMKREQWWDPRMELILRPPPGWQPPTSQSALFHKGKRRAVLVKMLIDATTILRRGERLPARLIVPIMQRLICSPDTQKSFKGKGWRGFRRANRQFLGISPADSASSDSDEDE
ncbi:hypothetical protein ACSSS7_003133 [Eimeria intestinalis]